LSGVLMQNITIEDRVGFTNCYIMMQLGGVFSGSPVVYTPQCLPAPTITDCSTTQGNILFKVASAQSLVIRKITWDTSDFKYFGDEFPYFVTSCGTVSYSSITSTTCKTGHSQSCTTGEFTCSECSSYNEDYSFLKLVQTQLGNNGCAESDTESIFASVNFPLTTSPTPLPANCYFDAKFNCGIKWRQTTVLCSAQGNVKA